MRLQRVADIILLAFSAFQFIFWALVLLHLATGFILGGGSGTVRQLIVFASPLRPGVGDSVSCDDFCLLKRLIHSLGAAAVLTLLLAAIVLCRCRGAIRAAVQALRTEWAR